MNMLLTTSKKQSKILMKSNTTKTCLYCGKELTKKSQKQFCNNRCHQEYKKQQVVNDWLNGKIDGTHNGIVKSLKKPIRDYLIHKAGCKCEECGWDKINPYTKKRPLEIHHKDGNSRNNRPENLQVLCPNCHSLTPNYKASNRSKRTYRKGTFSRKRYCTDCGKEINKEHIRCKECETKNRNIAFDENLKNKISREELKHLIRNKPFVEIGKQFNVSDNAIRKWCKRYNLPTKSFEIRKISDKDWDKI